MKAAIIQSNYIPWKGYFDMIHEVDVFVFYDDVKYTREDWRNRNLIKGSTGTFWLTIPVKKDAVHLPINQVKVANSRWQKKHFLSIKTSYSRAKYFDKYMNFLKKFYLDSEWKSLSELNQYMIKSICDFLNIKTEFILSSDFNLVGSKTDKLISLLKQLNASCYISGPSAKDYIETEKLEKADIVLEYKDYSGYPKYKQLWGEFNHYVSIIDLIFNCGPKAPYYIWGWRDGK